MDLQGQLIMLRGVIAGTTEDEQREIKAAAELIREVIETAGDCGKCAVALVAMECAVAA